MYFCGSVRYQCLFQHRVGLHKLMNEGLKERPNNDDDMGVKVVSQVIQPFIMLSLVICLSIASDMQANGFLLGPTQSPCSWQNCILHNIKSELPILAKILIPSRLLSRTQHISAVCIHFCHVMVVACSLIRFTK